MILLSSEWAQHDLGLCQMVVDVDWNIRDANGIADLQPQGRILLDPNLAKK